MTDIARLIADMVSEGVSAEIVGRVAAALAEREPVLLKDDQAERRRMADRERKQRLRNSAESAEIKPPLISPSLSPTPPNSPPYNPPKTKPRRADGAPDGAFEACWRSFPHVKTRMSKNKALTEFRKLPPAEQSALSQAIQAFDENLRDRDREYVPAMERWLRDGKHRAFLPADSPEAVPRSDLIRAYRHSGTWLPDWGDKPTPEELAA